MLQVFEKLAALLFLLLLVGMVVLLIYVPLPLPSEKVILMIIGGLMTASTGALPKLFGSENMRERVRRLEQENEMLKNQYTHLMAMLVERHVVKPDQVQATVINQE